MDVYEIVTNRILELMAKGTVPWKQPWTLKAGNMGMMHQNYVTKKVYRGINPWLLMATAVEKGFTSPYWLTFKQIQALDGKIKKGEKSTMIIFWKFIEKEEKGDNGETEMKKIPYLRYYNVFNYDQCEGLPEKKVEVIKVKPIKECEKIIKGYSDKPVIKHGDNRAYYHPMRDEIHMPDKDQFKSMNHYYGTLFHESAHSTGHESRLNRLSLTRDREAYGKEELVAEMTSAFLCGKAGIDNTFDLSAAYIDGWMKQIKADTKMVVIAAAQAQKASDYILGIKYEKEEVENV